MEMDDLFRPRVHNTGPPNYNISKTSQKLWRLLKRKLIAYIIITCNQSAIVKL